MIKVSQSIWYVLNHKMPLFQRIQEYRERRKFGEVAQVLEFPAGAAQPDSVWNGAFYHVAGPVDVLDRHHQPRLLLARFDVQDRPDRHRNLMGGAVRDSRDIVPAGLIGEEGCLKRYSRYSPNAELVKALYRLSHAYLYETIDRFSQAIHRVTPLNECLFMLPLDKEGLTGVMQKVSTFDDLTMTERQTRAVRPYEFLNRPEPETPLERSLQYLQELVFWQLDESDYSDHVNISITERTKFIDESKLQRTYSIQRNWSKANQGSTADGRNDKYRVVEVGMEKVIITGTEMIAESIL